MSKIQPGSQTLIYPMPVLLVGAKVDDKPNFMAVGWGGIANGEPPMISVALRHQRYTLKGIKQNMTFSVNVPSTDLVKETDYCGIISGAKVNKAEVCRFKIFYGNLNNAPLIEQCPVNLECKVVHTNWARSVSDKARSSRSLLRLPFIRISQLGLIYFVLILLYNCGRKLWKCQAHNNLEVDTMEFTPAVNQAAEFLEISNDFTNPKEVVREAISNSFDAGAKNIKIEIYVDRSSGIDELVINIEDDGEGMDEEQLKAFFGLGYSTRVAVDERGFKVSPTIGEKGHGTKVYFNSRRIEVKTWKNNRYLEAYMDSPRQALQRQELPKVIYETKESKDQRHGSTIIIFGYNSNTQAGFSHDEIKDYVYWFTKFGSPESEVGKETYKDVKIQLKGLGAKGLEELNFGHKFAKVNTDVRTLKGKDKISPLDYYVARWVFNDAQVIGKPGCTIDFVFYIEGDKAKREYNKMIHEKWQAWKPGEYDVGDRYGLWLCKDHIPIQQESEWNKWVAEKSEWTKYHAFVNCQDFKLTANRGDLENTPPDLLEAVGKTVKDLFDNKIKPTKEFQKYREELVTEQVERTAQQEEADFNRRRKETLGKNAAEIDGIALLEPRNEGGVFSLFMQLKTARPDLFDFKVVDYDTSLGYDLLVTKDTALDLNQASMKFVEMKYELKRSFNHSFGKLWAIVCWDCKLANDEEVLDIVGEKRNMKITNKDYSDPNSYKKYMLVSNTAPHNIEVFVLKDYLKDKLGLDFRPRGM